MKQPAMGLGRHKDLLEKAEVAAAQYNPLSTREKRQRLAECAGQCHSQRGLANQTAEPAPQGEILGLVNHLGNSFEQLEKVVTVLEQRMGAVLRPSVPYDAGPECTANTQLGCALSIFVNRANALINGVEALTDRIEL